MVLKQLTDQLKQIEAFGPQDKQVKMLKAQLNKVNEELLGHKEQNQAFIRNMMQEHKK